MSTTRAVLSDRSCEREHVLTKIHSDDFIRTTAPSFEIPSVRLLVDEDEEDRSGRVYGAQDAAAPRNDLVKFRNGYSRSGRPWNFFAE